MVKKSLLTPVLSGILAVSVIGSGAYYFVSNNSGSSDDESSSGGKKGKNSSDKSVVQKVEDVKDEVKEQAEVIEKAISGELDFSYNASLTFTPGEVITSQADIKSIALNASAKQKGDVTGFSLSGAYDGKTLATANIVGDRGGDKIYAQVPELSSTYVSVTGDSLRSFVENQIQAPLEAYVQKSAEAASQQGVDIPASTMPDYNELINAVGSIDIEALEKDIEEYVELAADNFPEGKEAADTKGTVDGVTYELTTKTYDVTVDDAVKIAKAVAQKAKDDQLVKDFLDQQVIKDMTQFDSSKYTSEMQALIDELDKASAESGDNKLVSFDVMFDADGNASGFNLDMGDEGSMYAVMAMVDNNIVVDVKFSADEMDMTIAGAIKDENDVLNGSIKVNAKEGSEDVSFVYTMDNVDVSSDVMTGTIGFEVTADNQTAAVALTSNSTDTKTDLTVSALMNSQKMFDVNFLLEETDASDITVPTDSIEINLNDGTGAKEYAATIDIEGFEANLKDALGDELFDEIFGGSQFKTIAPQA